MKLFKYILFLILSFFIGIAIYFGTQEGEFSVEKSMSIQAPTELVFQKINEFSHWPQWVFTQEEVKLFYGDTTSGPGAFLSWKGKEYFPGEIKTLEVIPQKTINQRFGFHRTSVDKGHQLQWNLTPNHNDTATEVHWKATGTLSLFEKMSNAFKKSSMEEQVNAVFAISLNQLDSLLTQEMNIYSVVIEGLTQHGGGFYLYKNAAVPMTSLREEIVRIQTEILDFMADNSIVPNGNHFVLYHHRDTQTDRAVISVGIPISDRIITEEGSSVIVGHLPLTTCLKASLKGNYIKHSEEVWRVVNDRMETNNWKLSSGMPVIEKFVVTPQNEKNPALWLSEMYFPLDELSLGTNNPLP